MKQLSVFLVAITLLFFSANAFAGTIATKDECVVKCHEAAALISSKGLDEAKKIIEDPHGPFVWKDSYVFLMNLDGKMLAHPIKPELTHRNHVLLITDPKDKALFVHFVNMAKNTGHGWVEYLWPKPGKNTPWKKITYIYRVPETDLFVGAGVYVGGMMY
ncbi:MAG: cache domain-containing protein [Holophagae bacterium]|nr:cache domain-containing protein [Holophagae bacterium]